MLPDHSSRTIKALPLSILRLSGSRIRQIDTAPANTVTVQVQSPSGTEFYSVEKYEKSGGWDWRIVPLTKVVDLNGTGPWSSLRVEGGFGLLGGHISSEPVDWLPPVQRSGAASEKASSKQDEHSRHGSNQVRLTFERIPISMQDLPGFTPPWDKTVSETPFSSALSNASSLNLRP